MSVNNGRSRQCSQNLYRPFLRAMKFDCLCYMLFNFTQLFPTRKVMNHNCDLKHSVNASSIFIVCNYTMECVLQGTMCTYLWYLSVHIWALLGHLQSRDHESFIQLIV